MKRPVLAAVLLFGGSALAQAGLIGSTVDVQTYFGAVYDDPGPIVVSTSIEFPTGSFPNFKPVWSVDIADTALTLRSASEGSEYFVPGTFNGFILTIVSGPIPTSAVSDPASTLVPVDIHIVGNEVRLNYQGVTSGLPAISIIDFTFSANVPLGGTLTPEPSAAWLIPVALAALALRRLRLTAVR